MCDSLIVPRTSLGTLVSEVSLFQVENIMYLYKVGTRSSVLINQGVLISGCLKRGSSVYHRRRNRGGQGAMAPPTKCHETMT